VQVCDYGSSLLDRILRYLNLPWCQTHNARLASYEISAALAAELQVANAAADKEAAAEREATSMPGIDVNLQEINFHCSQVAKKEAEATAGKGDGDVRIRMERKPQVVYYIYYVCLDLANGFPFHDSYSSFIGSGAFMILAEGAWRMRQKSAPSKKPEREKRKAKKEAKVLLEARAARKLAKKKKERAQAKWELLPGGRLFQLIVDKPQALSVASIRTLPTAGQPNLRRLVA